MTRYDWTQEQRRIETAVRAQKDITIAAKASGDDFTRREAYTHINDLQARYDKISKAAGPDAQHERMGIAGVRTVKTIEQLKPRTEYGTMKSYNEMLDNRKSLKRSELRNGLAINGNANSITDPIHDSGKVLQRRIYGKDERATTDSDTSNHNRPDLHPTGTHKHNFNYSKKARARNQPTANGCQFAPQR